MGKNLLDVFVSQEGDVTIVTVVGPVDSATLDIFKDQVDPLCAKIGNKVLLDCRDLTYLNSRAIGLLMKFHRSLMISRGHFVMCNLNPKLVRTLELLQIGKALSVFPNREDALVELRKVT